MFDNDYLSGKWMQLTCPLTDNPRCLIVNTNIHIPIMQGMKPDVQLFLSLLSYLLMDYPPQRTFTYLCIRRLYTHIKDPLDYAAMALLNLTEPHFHSRTTKQLALSAHPLKPMVPLFISPFHKAL